jgi:hypothetical protein
MTLGGNVDKLRRLADELHNFLMGRGALLRSLEELDEKLTALTKAETAKGVATSQREVIEKKLAESINTGQALKAQFDEIRRNQKVMQFIQIDSELRNLRNELIRTGFSRLGRPLKKLMSISERGDYPIPTEVRESTREYVRRPFVTFLAEEDGYPRLKSVMTALSRAVTTDKMALKAREAKKVVERAEQVVETNSLGKIHSEAKERKKAYDQLLTDSEAGKLVRQLKDLRKKGTANRAMRSEFEAELQRARDMEKKVDEQIHEILREVEAFSRKISGEDVKLQLA